MIDFPPRVSTHRGFSPGFFRPRGLPGLSPQGYAEGSSLLGMGWYRTPSLWTLFWLFDERGVCVCFICQKHYVLFKSRSWVDSYSRFISQLFSSAKDAPLLMDCIHDVDLMMVEAFYACFLCLFNSLDQVRIFEKPILELKRCFRPLAPLLKVEVHICALRF